MNILITAELSAEDACIVERQVPCVLIEEGIYAVPSDCMAELRRFNIPYRVEEVG